MSRVRYQEFHLWFHVRVIQGRGMIIRYPIHPLRYWTFHLTPKEFEIQHRNIVEQMRDNHISETFAMLDKVAINAVGENFGEPIWNDYPLEPVL